MKNFVTKNDPREKGFFMPGEWQEHTCCWMAWPCRSGLWADSLATKIAYADVANNISRFEVVKMLVPMNKTESAKKLLNKNIDIIEMSIDDSWCRDSGPNFLINNDGDLAGSTWEFNAWGKKYQPYDQDALMGSRILKLAGANEYTSLLVAEGGGITVDGEGTIITTESCFLNTNRNPNWKKSEVEEELCRTLGASKVIWIPGDPDETETDGHIDGIAAFIEPGRVLLEINKDKTDPHYHVGEKNRKALQTQKDAKGRKIEIEFIGEGIYHPEIWNEGCSSYINSYLANGAVIVPGYGYDRDGEAVEVYKNIYPKREVIQVQINDIAIGGGGIHCITQQQPKVKN